MTIRVSIALTSCDDYTHLEVEVTADQLDHLHNLAKWSRHIERGLWLDVTVLPPQTAEARITTETAPLPFEGEDINGSAA